MTDKDCCCNSFFKNYNEVEDDYEIQRLKDIIEICEFLIQVKKHRKEKRETFDKLFEQDDEEEEEEEIVETKTERKPEYPFHVYRYRYPRDYNRYVPYWNRIWF